MLVIGKNVVSGVGREIRAVALAADQAAVLATPVDTGRARGNWIASVGSPSDEADRPNDKTGRSTMSAASGAIADAGAEDTVYIANNVEYIVPLENGHSKQAPGGMLRHAVKAGMAILNRGRVLKG